LDETPTSIHQQEAAPRREPVAQAGSPSEQAKETAPVSQDGPSLAEPLASSASEHPHSSPESSAPVPPAEAPAGAAEEGPAPAPTPEAVEPKRIEQRVGLRVITLR
jgi:hypothetical protein